MLQALHDGHLVHDSLGVVDDLLAGILQPHLHHLLHRKLLAREHVVDYPDDATGPAAQLVTYVILGGDDLGQVVGQIGFHVVEDKQLVLWI